MFQQGTRGRCVFVDILAIALLTALLGSPSAVLAQRHGGGGGGAGAGTGGGTGGRPTICVHDCGNNREGMSSEDSLKNFRRVIALQATAEQRAAFAKISKYTQTASDQLKTLTEFSQKAPTSSTAAAGAAPNLTLAERGAALDEAIAQARAGNQNFLGSMSDAQKSGLKEITTRIAKADTELDKQLKALDQTVQTAKPDHAQVATSTASLDKELASFQTEQLALGKEMGILLDGSSQGLAFNLPTVTNSLNVASETVSIPTSGVVSRTSIEDGHTLFSLQLVSDLSDLQQNITGLLRSSLTRQPRCGERIEIQQARLTPMVPASLVVVNLSYERWVCQSSGSRSLTAANLGGAVEVASGEAEIEIKLTPSIEANAATPAAATNAGLHLVSEIRRVQAEGFLRSSLQSGDLGETLRDQIAVSVASALQKTIDLQSTLPAVAQQSATLQKIQFQDAGADQLTIVLDGQLQFSDEQTQQFASQLKERVSAEKVPAP